MKAFTIPFVGLKLGEHRFDYQIGNAFFESREEGVVHQEYNNVKVKAEAVLTKKSNSLEFDFIVKGMVNVNCDLTNEPFDQPISGTHKLVVNFGETFNDDDESLLVVPHGTHEIDVAHFFYELIVLSVPQKRVHPGVEDGTLDSEILDKLEELSPKDTKKKPEDDETDPRWDKLKNLLTDK